MSSKLNDFADQDLKIIDSKKINENNIIVSTKIFSKKDAQEIAVEWRIYIKDSKLLARDLVVEGLSLARTQKEEFSSMVTRRFDPKFFLVRLLVVRVVVVGVIVVADRTCKGSASSGARGCDGLVQALATSEFGVGRAHHRFAWPR